MLSELALFQEHACAKAAATDFETNEARENFVLI